MLHIRGMKTQPHHPKIPLIDTDPEELLIVDLDPETDIEPIGDDPTDSSSGQHVFELLNTEAAEGGPSPGAPIDVDDEVTSRYFRKTSPHA
jgi:hypothetical protein